MTFGKTIGSTVTFVSTFSSVFFYPSFVFTKWVYKLVVEIIFPATKGLYVIDMGLGTYGLRLDGGT